MQLSRQEGLRLARALYRENRLREMQSLCHELLRAEPDHSEALELLALALMQHEDFEQALVPLSRLLALEPGLPMHHVRRGECLLGLEQALEARQCFEAALRLVPEHLQALTHLATLALAGGDDAAAIRNASTVLRLNPHSAEAHELLARALCRQGNAQQALRHFTTCIELRPAHASVRGELARLLLALGRNDEALHQYRCALLCDASNVAILRALAETLLLLERYDEADPLLERLRTLRPEDASILLLRGQSLERRGEAHPALALYAEAARHEESTLDAFHLMMLNLRGQGRYQEALDCCRQLLAHEEYRPGGLWWHQAQLQAITGDDPAALASFDRHGAELLAGCPSAPPPLTATQARRAGRRTRVLLYPSGLYADDLVFLQWLPLLKTLPAIEPVLLCPPLLRTLIAERFGIETFDRDEAAGCAFGLSLYSLPQFCLDAGLCEEDATLLPPRHPARTASSQHEPASPRPRIGLAWRGPPSWPGLAGCELPPAVFPALQRRRDAELLTLQWDWRHTAPSQGSALSLDDSAAFCRDYRDIAELLAGCDLVLACDSAVAVLAALSGKRVLLPHQGGRSHWLSCRAALEADKGATRLLSGLLTEAAETLDEARFPALLEELLPTTTAREWALCG